MSPRDWIALVGLLVGWAVGWYSKTIVTARTSGKFEGWIRATVIEQGRANAENRARIEAIEQFWRDSVERRRGPADLLQLAKLTQAIISKYEPEKPNAADQ